MQLTTLSFNIGVIANKAHGQEMYSAVRFSVGNISKRIEMVTLPDDGLGYIPPRFLDALASLNEIGAAINRLEFTDKCC